jgi:hypothetical protein
MLLKYGGVNMADAVVDAVGTNPTGNIHLQPEQHAARLRTAFPLTAPLYRILTENQFATSMRDPAKRVNAAATMNLYELADDQAMKCQTKYNHAIKWIFVAIAVAVFLSGVATNWGIPKDVTTPWGANGANGTNKVKIEWLARPLFIVFTYLALLVPLTVALLIKSRRYYENWQTKRGEAEFLRRRLFEDVMDTDVAASPGSALPLRLKLEYFRRYQLELQREYYKVKGGIHHVSAARVGKYVMWCGIILSLWLFAFILESCAAISDQAGWLPEFAGFAHHATSFAQVLTVKNWDIYFLAVALLLSVFLGVIYVNVLLKANVRNAKRFKIAEQNLDYLSGTELAAARAAADADNAEGVWNFIHRVHSVMSAEFNEWVQLRDLDANRDVAAPRAQALPTPPTQAASG